MKNKYDDIIKEAMLSDEGKIKLAQAMAQPIRTRLNYGSMASRILNVEPLKRHYIIYS